MSKMTIEEKYKIALEALEAIDSPIAYFRKNLKEGEQLDGGYIAWFLSKPQFYQERAQEALMRINNE